jgi:WhiB family redox-sensing transcriptional regulator
MAGTHTQSSIIVHLPWSGDGTSGLGDPTLLASRPAWHDDALCRTAPLDIDWFAETHTGIEAAKRVCRQCPVQRDCLEWSLAQNGCLKGVWAGLTQRGRQRLRSGSKTQVA